MLTTPRNFRQASILKILEFGLLAALFSSCRMSPPRTPPFGGGTIGKNSPDIVTANPPSPAPVQPTAPLVLRKTELPPVAPSQAKEVVEPVPAPILQRTIELPETVAGGDVIRLSDHQWRAVSRRRPSLSDSPPSLMEDAIITSAIHARLLNFPTSRQTPWQYSSNSGVVNLAAPNLTRSEAISALQAILTLDKVVEIRLNTRLR